MNTRASRPTPTLPPVRRFASLLTACAVAVAVGCFGQLSAQQVPGSPSDPQAQDPGAGFGPVRQPAGVSTNLPNTFLDPNSLFQGQGAAQPDGTTSIWSSPTAPSDPGFPVFPTRLSGFGVYPLPFDPDAELPLGALPLTGLPLGAMPVDKPGWPDWARLAGREPVPFEPERALLVMHSGRVWHRASADEVYVPLYFYDKFVGMSAGGQCEVRHRGEAEFVLHDSTSVQTSGPTTVTVVALDDENVRMRFERLDWVRIEANRRQHRIELPDGSMLEFDGVGALPATQALGSPLAPTPTTSPVAPGVVPPTGFGGLFGLAGAVPVEPLPQPVRVEILRADEPRWHGGRAVVSVLGGGSVRWVHAFGETTIAPGERITVLLQAPKVLGDRGAAPADDDAVRVAPGIGAKLGGDGVQFSQQGGAVRCEAGSGNAGYAEWCGARIDLPAGASVTFDPIVGSLAPRVDG